MIPYIVSKLAPNSIYFPRGLIKQVPGRGYFRAVPFQNGDKFVTSPPPPQSLNDSPAEEQQHHRPGKAPGSARLYVDYNRTRNRPRALQGGRQSRRHRSNEREDCATREPERAWITGDRWRLHVR